MAEKKSTEKNLKAVTIENAVTATNPKATVAERFLAKEVQIANEQGLTAKTKLHLEMVRAEVAKQRKGAK